jgi:hypothetical protein
MRWLGWLSLLKQWRRCKCDFVRLFNLVLFNLKQRHLATLEPIALIVFQYCNYAYCNEERTKRQQKNKKTLTPM